MNLTENKIDEAKIKKPITSYYWTCDKCGTYKIPSNTESCPCCKARKPKFCRFYTFGSGRITYKGEESNKLNNISMAKLNAYGDSIQDKSTIGDKIFLVLFTLAIVAIIVCLFSLII